MIFGAFIGRKNGTVDKNGKKRGPDRTERAIGYDVKWQSRFNSMLDALGFSATKKPVSALLTDREIGRLSSMKRQPVRRRTGASLTAGNIEAPHCSSS